MMILNFDAISYMEFWKSQGPLSLNNMIEHWTLNIKVKI